MIFNKNGLIPSGRWLERGDFIFFWGHTAPEGVTTKACMSQWWPCRFEVDGITYNCAEQYMMAQKALLFGDKSIANAILDTDDPSKQKALGRLVSGYNERVWHENRDKIVWRGNYAKFTQNPELTQFLISTGDKILAEASPKDFIWGIGLAEHDFRATDPGLWRGENLLGFILMDVRQTIRKQILLANINMN